MADLQAPETPAAAIVSPHRCPDCGVEFHSASTLVDHSLTTHVRAPTRAAGIRRTRWPWVPRAIGGLGVLLGVAFTVLIVLAGAGLFDKKTVAERPDSVVHRISVELVRSDEADDYRAVEPNEDWDTEYELDGGDAVLRMRDEGGLNEEIEYEAFPGDLEAAIEDALDRHDFLVDD